MEMTNFESIYQKYFHDIYRYIRRLSGDEQIAEEITSQTFFKAIQKIDQFQGNCSLKIWLCQIAKNCYYDYLRDCRKVEHPEDEVLFAIPDVKHLVEDLVVNAQDAERIKAVLRTIPQPYKDVFAWRVIGELDFRQIGELFGKSQNWACVTYHRARKMIQDRLEE